MKRQFQSFVDGMTLGGGSIQHPLSIHSASIGTRWKPRGLQVLMTLVFLFTMGIGQMWADGDLTSPYTLTFDNTTGGISATMASNKSVSTDASGAKATGDAIKATWTLSLANNNTALAKNSNGLKVGNSNSTNVYDATFSSSSFSSLTITQIEVKVKNNSSSNSGKAMTTTVTVNVGGEAFDVAKSITNTTTATALTFASSTGKSGNISINIANTGEYINHYYVQYIKVTFTSGGGCTAPTNATITANPANAEYTAGDNISLTASAENATSATFTWYKGTDWATASAGSSVGTGATFSKNSCTTNDEGTYWCNISNGTGCEVQVSKAITVASSGGGDPDPGTSNLYFHFFKAADATTNGVTNSDKFASMVSDGSNMSGSITIDSKAYSVTRRTGDNEKFGEFTVSANKKATFYALAVSSGDGARKLKLVRKSDSKTFVIDVAGGSSSYKSVSADNIPTGTYEIKRYDNNKVRLGMVAIKEVDATYYTASFDVDGGSEVAPQSILENDTVVKPSDPTKSGNDFAGWVVKSTSAAYTWSTPVTAAVELKATWTPQVTKYSVTYAAGEGTGTMTDANEYKENDEVTVLDNAFTTPAANKKFSGWSSSPSVTISNGKFSMPASNVTLTAQWTEFFTITYKDGESTLKTEDVFKNAAPVGYTPTKALNTFAGWKDGDGNTVDPTTLTAAATLFAQWTKVYVADDASFDFQANTTLGEITVSTTKAEVSGNVGNMLFSAMDIQYGQSDEGAFYGWKIKEANATIRFYVENDRRLQVTLGDAGSGAGFEIAYTVPGASSVTNASLANNAVNTYDVAAGTLVTLTTKNTSNTVTLQSIVLSDIPALSDDATLSDLKVAGTTVSGFAASTLHYYYELDYGFTSYPTVTYTKNHDAATIVYQDASQRDDDCSIVKVTAENGTTINQYIIHFYAAPKYGVELIKATHTGAKTASKAGYWTSDATVDKNTYDNSKLGGKDNYFGLTLGGTKKFMNGDLVVIYLDPDQNASAWLQLFKDKGSNMIADVQSGVKKGANYITLAGLPEEGIDALYLYRTEAAAGNMNPYANYIAVYRLMAPFIESFEITGVEDFVIDQDLKTITASVANSFDVTALTPTVKFWANGGGSIDKTEAQDFTNPVTYTVSSAYAEDATGDYAPVIYTVTITKVVPSVEPTITTQPASANYVEGATIAVLTVVAESAEGELSYQWQVKNGINYEDIEGANAASYAPAISAIGSYTYRVVVTNTEESKPATSVESDDATIVIAADPACATFAEASIPTAEPYQYTNTGEWTIYNASSSGKRNGSDQVFTDVKDFDGNNVKGYAKERCVLIFEKDMKQVRFYSANAQRSWGETPVRVSDDVESFLGTATPSYSAAEATTSIIQNDPNNNKEQIFIADGEFLAGKCYWFAFSGSLQIFRICAAEADPKADAPVFSGTLSDEAICPGNTFATLDATASPVTSYAWYKDDEVIENAEAATYTPTEAGTYYCIATNSAAGYRSASTKSAEAVLSVNTVTAITAHVDAVGTVDAEKTISVTAEGTNLTYQWQACDANGDVTDATVLGTAASLNVVIAAETKYYLATVTGACGVETQVVEAREWHEVEPVNVTGSRVWNWTSAAFNGIDEAIAFGNTSVEELMANVSSKVPNYESFRSDMLYGTGQYVWRPDDRYFQGFKIRFVTTVPGIVKVTYRGTGNNKNIILTINDSTYAEYQGGFTTVKNFVQAGEVVIEGVGGTGNAGGMTRIQRIQFIAEDDYHRTVNPANIGTLCWTNNAVLVNATLYELAGKDANSKLVFDEVEGNKLVAGKPYIFVPENGNTQIKVFNTDDAEPMTEAQLQPVNYMYGTLAGKTLTQEDDAEMYYFSGRNIWRVADFNVAITIPANCCYVDYPAVLAEEEPAPAPAPGRRRITMGGKGANAATGFESIDASEKPVKLMIDGNIYILRGEKMYDATGRLVK